MTWRLLSWRFFSHAVLSIRSTTCISTNSYFQIWLDSSLRKPSQNVPSPPQNTFVGQVFPEYLVLISKNDFTDTLLDVCIPTSRDYKLFKDKDSSVNILGQMLLTNYSCLINTTCTKDGWKEGSWPEILLEFDNDGSRIKTFITWLLMIKQWDVRSYYLR